MSKFSTVPRKTRKTKFHINSKGEAAVCNAIKKPCPLGEHWDTFAEAQSVADLRMEEAHGLLAGNENSEWDLVPLGARRYSTDAPRKVTYIDPRDFSSKRIFSKHMRNERMRRLRRLQSLVGKGEPIAVFHVYDESKQHVEQYHEIRDNGLLYVYDMKNPNLVVTMFCPKKYRVRDLYNDAGFEVPPALYERVEENTKNKYNDV